jgi:hypothetical protein
MLRPQKAFKTLPAFSDLGEIDLSDTETGVVERPAGTMVNHNMAVHHAKRSRTGHIETALPDTLNECDSKYDLGHKGDNETDPQVLNEYGSKYCVGKGSGSIASVTGARKFLGHKGNLSLNSGIEIATQPHPDSLPLPVWDPYLDALIGADESGRCTCGSAQAPRLVPSVAKFGTLWHTVQHTRGHAL